MPNKNTKFEFLALLTFLIAAVLLLSNGFVSRIFAQDNQVDVYQQIEPIGVTLDHILREYVQEVDLDQVVEGALTGIMLSLDRNSSFIPADALKEMRSEVKGEFEGIGVSIKLDDQNRIMVHTPIEGSPAAKAGIMPFDRIIKIDGESTEGLKLDEAAGKIRGKRGTYVDLTIERPGKANAPAEIKDFSVKRDRVPLESIKEARLLDGGIAYIRISDFKDNTSADLKRHLISFLEKGMTGLVLDLRWNPGGLLTASQQVCELFLPRNSLVTYTKGRTLREGKKSSEDMELYTERRPVLPLELPIIVLINESTASSSEIVTGALQFHQRALVLGEKTFGKGSVQTIIPLERPEQTALRLTTALYYTPADVTIDHQGILPDIAVPMSREDQELLRIQMLRSFEDDPDKVHEQNHGSVTGNVLETSSEESIETEQKLIGEIEALYGEETSTQIAEFLKRRRAIDSTIEDTQLMRAVEILREDSVWDNLLKKYHLDVRETQIAADAKPKEPQPQAETPILDVTSPELLPELPEDLLDPELEEAPAAP